MTRIRVALTLSTLGLAGLLGLTGCGLATTHTVANRAAAAAADVSDEAYALQTVGFDTSTAAAPAPSASAAAGSKAKAEHRRAIRKYLRRNTLHGEVTVQGKDGVKTIVVQRGTVTAVTSTSVSVKSSDGFAATWAFGDQLKLVQDKKVVQTSALKTGEAIGIAGTKDGTTDTARLVVIK